MTSVGQSCSGASRRTGAPSARARGDGAGRRRPVRSNASIRCALGFLLGAALVGCGGGEVASKQPEPLSFRGNVNTGPLCFTEGQATPDPDLAGYFKLDDAVEGPSFRGVMGYARATPGNPNGGVSPQPLALASGSDGGNDGYQRAELRFRYDGPYTPAVYFSAGVIRHQVAVKLRARDACNVLYATWVFAECNDANANHQCDAGESTAGPRILVQRKSNSASRSSVCRDNGYSRVTNTLTPQPAIPAPVVGQQHSLDAELINEHLKVWIDQALVFEAEVPGISSVDGPPGVRTDNVKAAILLAASDYNPALNNGEINTPYWQIDSAYNGTGPSGKDVPYTNTCP